MSEPTDDKPFDPYRFGAPAHAVPPEFAPPGYEETGYHPPAPEPAPASGPASIPSYGHPGPPPGYGQPPAYGPGPGQSQYPPPVYGAYPPPGYPAYGQPSGNTGKTVTGLIFGILSIILCWLTFFDIVPITLGFLFSSLGLAEAKRRGASRTMAKAGLWLTAAGTALALAVTIGAAIWMNNTDCSKPQRPGSLNERLCETQKNR